MPSDLSELRLRALRVVEATHELGSAVAAAAALHVSTSAVSRSIRQSELALGVPLFERGSRGMVCTLPGQALVRACAALRRDLGQGLLVEAGGVRHAPPARRVESLLRVLTVPMLRCLVTCAELSSETLAAQRLGLSQPAVSQHLRALQRAYGWVLVQRTRHGTRLTREGARVLMSAKLVLNTVRVMQEQVGALRGDDAGRLRLGVLPMASTVLAPEALAGLLQRMPRVLVSISDGTYEAMVAQLRVGDLDLLIGPLRGALAAPDLEEHGLFRESLIAVVRPGHRLARSRRQLPLQQLCAHPWVAPLENTPARAAFERAFSAAGLPLPTVSLQANSPALVRAVLLRSDHVALVSPLQIAEDLHGGTLVQVGVALRDVERHIGLTWRRGFALPPSALCLMEELAAAPHSRFS